MYEKDGIVWPRVTDIISDCTNSSHGLMQWSANQVVDWIKENCESEEFVDFYWVYTDSLEQARYAYKDTSRIALDVGSDVHNAIEKHLKKESYTLASTQAEQAFKAFIEWEDSVELKPFKLEQTVWGKNFAGTLDFYGLYKGKLYVIDWKTSKAFYPEMRFQVAAYRNEMDTWLRSTSDGPRYLKTDGCGVLMLDKSTGMPTFKDTSKTYNADLAVFEAMVNLFYLRHPRIRKRFEKGE